MKNISEYLPTMKTINTNMQAMMMWSDPQGLLLV